MQSPLPTIIVSRDGKRAVALTEIGHRSEAIDLRGGVGSRIAVQIELEPRTDPVYATVYLPHWTYGEYMVEQLGMAPDRESVARELVLYGIGVALDAAPLDLTPPRPGDAAQIRTFFGGLEERIRDRGARLVGASDEKAFAYFAAKVHAAYDFRYPAAEFSIADEARLGIPAGDLTRIALRGEGRYWTRGGSASHPTWTATARLLEDLPAGRVPGHPRSPIHEVSEKLSAPRYAAVAEAWRKAIDFTTGDSPDPANGAKEAVSAVESMTKILEEAPSATMGDAVKGLRNSGRIREPLDKVFHRLWGFSSNAGGVRHGGVDLPDVDLTEATFILNMAASSLLYLLELDRVAASVAATGQAGQ